MIWLCSSGHKTSIYIMLLTIKWQNALFYDLNSHTWLLMIQPFVFICIVMTAVQWHSTCFVYFWKFHSILYNWKYFCSYTANESIVFGILSIKMSLCDRNFNHIGNMYIICSRYLPYNSTYVYSFFGDCFATIWSTPVWNINVYKYSI